MECYLAEQFHQNQNNLTIQWLAINQALVVQKVNGAIQQVSVNKTYRATVSTFVYPVDSEGHS